MDVNSIDRTIQSAARWYARLQASDCTPADREEFARWCGADPANAAAYAKARDLAALVTRSAAGDPRLRALAEQALAGGPAVAAARQRRRELGLAAALALGVATVLGIARLTNAPVAPTVNEAAAHVATQDTTRTLTLDDGTIVSIDVRTDLEIRFNGDRREVSLREGRALFDVAHDPARPFVVTAGADRVTAVGTRFQVARTPAETVVTLAEGIVTVSGVPGGAERAARLVPGDELKITASDEAWVMHTVDPRLATSWSLGRLMFREARLADALQEVNRYATTKVRLADSSLADLRVSGNFVAGDSRAAVNAFAAVLPLTIVDGGVDGGADGGGELAVYRRPSEQR